MTRRLALLTGCGLFAAGVLVGLTLKGHDVGSPPAQAAEQARPTPEERLAKLKIELPAVAAPRNTLVNAVLVGDMLYVSGLNPGKLDGKPLVGRLGDNYDLAKGQLAARHVGLQVLSVVKAKLGSLNKVERLVMTHGIVRATPEFMEPAEVLNGFSDLMVEVFGEVAGKGARTAMGTNCLEAGIPVEVEAIFQVRK